MTFSEISKKILKLKSSSFIQIRQMTFSDYGDTEKNTTKGLSDGSGSGEAVVLKDV